MSNRFMPPLLAAATLLSACDSVVPPLLEDIRPDAGWANACPTDNEAERRNREAHDRFGAASELEQRLAALYPAGSAADQLADSLSAQGFTLEGECASDASVRHASYLRRAGVMSSYGLVARVYWKVDDRQRIVWTRGSVSYVGR